MFEIFRSSSRARAQMDRKFLQQRRSRLPDSSFPLAAGLWLGLGLGGFFDGIVLHQLLQWHHMVSGWYPPTTLENLRINTLWDGIFHSATYVFVVLGLYSAWSAAHERRISWSGRALAGTVLSGWGIFNLVEGLIDHTLLGIHHVNESAARSSWVWWDAGFLAWGAAMLVIGWAMSRSTAGARARRQAVVRE